MNEKLNGLFCYIQEILLLCGALLLNVRCVRVDVLTY